MLQIKVTEKIKTHITCLITFFAKSDNIIGCMRFACWMTKATNTHSY